VIRTPSLNLIRGRAEMNYSFPLFVAANVNKKIDKNKFYFAFITNFIILGILNSFSTS